MSNKTRRPSPISASNIEIPASIRFLSERVMRELLASGAISMMTPTGQIEHHVKLEELRIVIMKGMAIAHRIGVGVGVSQAERGKQRIHS